MNISSITYCRNIALITLRNVPFESGVIGEIFTAISDNGVNVDMISQTAPLGSAISVAFTVSMESMGRLIPVVNGLKATCPELTMEASAGMTKLNFYDEDMVNTPGVAAHVFTTMARGPVPVTMITTSTVDISLLVQEHNEDIALSLCRETYHVSPEEVDFN